MYIFMLANFFSGTNVVSADTKMNGHLDELIHVQYKIDKGSIIVPFTASSPCVVDKDDDVSNSNKQKNTNNKINNTSACQPPVQALHYKVAVVNIFFNMDQIENIRTNLNVVDNIEINRMVIKNLVSSLNLIGALRLQCNDILYESYIDDQLGERNSYSYNYDDMFYKLSKIIIPTKMGIMKTSKKMAPFAKYLQPFYDLFIKKRDNRKYYYNSRNNDWKKKKHNNMQHIFQSLLLLSYTNSNGETIHLLPENRLKKCKLHILAQSEQTLRPPKDIKVFGTSLIGAYKLKSALKIAVKNNYDCSDVHKTTDNYGKQVTNLYNLFEDLSLPTISVIHNNHVNKDNGRKATKFLQLSGSEGEEGGETPPEEPKNGYEEVEGILDQVNAIVDPTFQEILAPLADAFMQWLADRSNEELHSTMPNEAGSTIEDSVTRETQPALDVAVTMNIGPALADALPEAIDGVVSGDAAQLAANKISEATVPPLSDMLSLSTVSAVATQATDYVGNKIARITSHQLALALGKSIPNAAVPAIVHTITHSPLQDYFCYYCYTHKTYCQYCNYAPSQLYYAQYYANFYSSYYPLYYADYHGSVSGTKRKKRASATDTLV